MLRTSLRTFLAHKGRMALSGIAVLLSVAFVSGTLVFTDSINATFDRMFGSTAADVTVTPHQHGRDGEGRQSGQVQEGRAASLPASVLTRAAAVPGVRAAYGVVSISTVTAVDARNRDIGPANGAPTIGTNWYPGRPAVRLTTGHAPHGPGEVVLDADTARAKHLTVGDRLRIIASPGTFGATIVGISEFRTTNPGATLVYTDTPTAQARLLGRPGAFTSVALDAAPGTTDAVLKRRVSAALATGGGPARAAAYDVRTRAETAAADKSSMGSWLNVIKDAMLGFAGVAVLVGIFLIVNTFSMLVTQRTREIGLLRAVGAGRGQVNRSVLLEGLLLGVTASTLGVAAGVGLAVGLMRLMKSTGMNLDLSDLTFRWPTPVVGYAVGVLVTLVAAYIPARRAGRVPPMAALRDAGTGAAGTSLTVRTAAGAVVTAAGTAALVLAARSTDASSGAAVLAAGVLLTLVGVVVLGPALARLLLRVLGGPLPALFGPVGRMAQRNAVRNPRRTGATAAALMIGLALVAAMSVVATSMVVSATAQLDRTVGADFIVQSRMPALPPQIVDAARRTPGLAHVTREKLITADAVTPRGRRPLLLLAADPTLPEDYALSYSSGGPDSTFHGTGVISVSRQLAKQEGLTAGSTLTVAFHGGRTDRLTVGGVIKDNSAIGGGASYVSVATARAELPTGARPLDALLFAQVAKGTSPAVAYRALKRSLAAYPQAQVRDQADYKKLIRKQVGMLLNMVYGLLALAIVVAVLGVVNTLALSVVERTREIGLLRAIGLSRRQLRRMVRLESVVIALFGAVLGLGLGLAWGVVSQRLLAVKGLDVLSIPWPTIAGVFAGAAVVGLLAALGPAVRASRMNVLEAIAAE